MVQERKNHYEKAKSRIEEKYLEGATLTRINRRGKTCVVLLNNKVQAILKFPSSNDLTGFTNLFKNKK